MPQLPIGLGILLPWVHGNYPTVNLYATIASLSLRIRMFVTQITTTACTHHALDSRQPHPSPNRQLCHCRRHLVPSAQPSSALPARVTTAPDQSKTTKLDHISYGYVFGPCSLARTRPQSVSTPNPTCTGRPSRLIESLPTQCRTLSATTSPCSARFQPPYGSYRYASIVCAPGAVPSRYMTAHAATRRMEQPLRSLPSPAVIHVRHMLWEGPGLDGKDAHTTMNWDKFCPSFMLSDHLCSHTPACLTKTGRVRFVGATGPCRPVSCPWSLVALTHLNDAKKEKKKTTTFFSPPVRTPRHS